MHETNLLVAMIPPVNVSTSRKDQLGGINLPPCQGIAHRQAGISAHPTKTEQTPSCCTWKLGLIVEKREGDSVPAVGSGVVYRAHGCDPWPQT